MTSSPITCHGNTYFPSSLDRYLFFSTVLDSSTGKPAEGVVIRLQQLELSEDELDIFHPLADG